VSENLSLVGCGAQLSVFLPWSCAQCTTGVGPLSIRPSRGSGLLTLYLNLDCRDGKFVREIAYLPLAEDIPVAFNSCRKGPRSIGWRDDKPAELYWAEAQVRRSFACIELREFEPAPVPMSFARLKHLGQRR